jgi:hypothetical protein
MSNLLKRLTIIRLKAAVALIKRFSKTSFGSQIPGCTSRDVVLTVVDLGSAEGVQARQRRKDCPPAALAAEFALLGPSFPAKPWPLFVGDVIQLFLAAAPDGHVGRGPYDGQNHSPDCLGAKPVVCVHLVFRDCGAPMGCRQPNPLQVFAHHGRLRHVDECSRVRASHSTTRALMRLGCSCNKACPARSSMAKVARG